VLVTVELVPFDSLCPVCNHEHTCELSGVDEVLALRLCFKFLEPLDEDAVRRALRYLSDRLLGDNLDFRPGSP
jgi:hypothetical protein